MQWSRWRTLREETETETEKQARIVRKKNCVPSFTLINPLPLCWDPVTLRKDTFPNFFELIFLTSQLQ